ncbi:MAG: dihydropteroate synthase [Candidatus Binataceae bacterium]
MAIVKANAQALRLRNGAVVRFPAVMGVLNVTPDSFSDGGSFLEPSRAIAHGLEMEAAGAAIIDIGGESSRPGAHAVSVETEMERVLPVIKGLVRRLTSPISIDTRKATVARAALEEGAAIVNDISGLQFDAAMLPTVAHAEAALVLMHMRGTPEVMTRLARYRDVVAEVCAFLRRQSRRAIEAGVPPSRIIVDPGLGFAKNARHNLLLIGGLPRIRGLGYPVLIGASRKSFIKRIAGSTPSELLYGTAAINALAIAAGAAIVRVHDPAPAVTVVRMAAAIAAASRT